MFKVKQHNRLAMKDYKGPKSTIQDIKGDSWGKKSKKKRKGAKIGKVADNDDDLVQKKSKRRKTKKKGMKAGC